uniref:Uncharacterized protein n=1 Tax=Anguilla anguilla TaxID=7936 RepID=A0A0E9QYN2_ANGAN
MKVSSVPSPPPQARGRNLCSTLHSFIISLRSVAWCDRNKWDSFHFQRVIVRGFF